MEVLKNINWDNVVSYMWKSADFKDVDNYLRNELVNYLESRHSFGVLFGCKLEVVAGFTLSVSPGLILFPNRQLVYFEGGEVNVAAADPALSRTDRISLEFAYENEASKANYYNVQITFNRAKKPLLKSTAGTPGGAIAPKVAADISIGSVTIGAAQAVLAHSDLLQDYSTFQISKDKSQFEREFPILNDQDPAEIAGISVDAAEVKGMSFTYHANRKTDDEDLRVIGKFVAVYDSVNAIWSSKYEHMGSDNLGFYPKISEAGVLEYKSTDMIGDNYEGKVTITEIKYF